MTTPSKVQSFPPVATPDARVLVLGSMPGRASLAATEYYAHPQNLFWTFMGTLFGAHRELPYPARLAVLGDRGVALWDTAHRCVRPGSLDADITDVEPNDIAGLLHRHPGIRAIFCNGRKSHDLFRRLVTPTLGPALGDRATTLRIEYLPSTSPANASIPPAAKLAAWRQLADWAASAP